MAPRTVSSSDGGVKPQAKVGEPQCEQGGLHTKVKKVFLNHLGNQKSGNGLNRGSIEKRTLRVL